MSVNQRLSLLHRRGLESEIGQIWPARDLFLRLGGRAVLERVIDGLYDRISEDPFLEPIFLGRAQGDHQHQKFFFEEWMGGEPRYRRDIGGAGTQRFHRKFPIDRRSAGRWLRHMVCSLRAESVADPLIKEIVSCLAPMAHTLGRDEVSPSPPIRFEGLPLSEKRRHLVDDPELLRAHPDIGRRLLFEACTFGDGIAATLYMDYGAPLNQPSSDQGLMLTPWCRASAGGFSDIAEQLAQRGAIQDVFSAAYLGDIALMSSWVADSAKWLNTHDPAMDHRRIGLLHHSVWGDRPEATLWLLSKGAKPDVDGFHLLQHAANAGWHEVIEAFLAAEVDATRVEPDWWVTQAGIASRLIAAGADVNRPAGAWLRFCGPGSPYGDAPRLIERCLELGAELGAQSGSKGALHLAASAGFVGIIDVLLNRGLAVDIEDQHGETPLAHVAWASPQADRLATTRLLLDRGADPLHSNRQGQSPLSRARRLKSVNGRERYRLMEAVRKYF